MRQVIDHGTGQVEDPARLEHAAAIGVDETAYVRANATRSTTSVRRRISLFSRSW